MIRDERTGLRHSPGEVRRAVVDFVRASAVRVRAARDGGVIGVADAPLLPWRFRGRCLCAAPL